MGETLRVVLQMLKTFALSVLDRRRRGQDQGYIYNTAFFTMFLLQPIN
jgi:hypothetical protein